MIATAVAPYLTSDSLSVAVATAAQFRNNTASKFLQTDKVWSSADTVALTWAAAGTTTVDFSAGINFTVTTATGNSTLSPANAKTGQSGFIYITQDASTARSLTFASSFIFAGGIDPVLTSTTSAKDILFYQVISSTGPVIYGTLIKNVS